MPIIADGACLYEFFIFYAIYHGIGKASSICLKLIIAGMGVCTSHLQKPPTHGHSSPIDVVPPDTSFLQHAALPILAFYVLVSDIKLKKCLSDRISLRFILEDIDRFTLPQQSPDRSSKVHWRAHHTFDFHMTEYELRKKFVVVQAMDGRGTELDKLKLNMFSLWNGPYHLDFPFPSLKGGNGRISFNFKISQGIHIRIANNYTQIMPFQEINTRDRLAYSIEAIIGQQLQQVACPYMVIVRENAQRQSNKDKCLVQRSCIHWQQSQSAYKFDKKVAYYQIYSSSLHLVFYKVVPKATSPTRDYQILGECFIPFRKIMAFDYLQSKDTSSKITYLQRTLELTEKAWLHGKEMGKVRLQLKFIMQAHLKQMQTGVRTQYGILASSPVFTQGGKSPGCEEISALATLNEEVQKQFIQIGKAYDHFNIVAMKENALRVRNLLISEIALLERSSKESILLYEYKDQKELAKAQRFLIDFAFKALTYAHQDKAGISETSWALLTTILKRGQLQLSQVGFSKQQRKALEKGEKTKELRSKVEVSLKYQQLLNHLLKETLISLQNKGQQAQRTFAQSFCAYAYFRIPAFRKIILTVISHQQDPQITEWRGTEANLYQSTKGVQQKGKDFYGLHFDWENHFYKVIESEQLSQQHSAELTIILRDAEWKQRLGKRGGAFFSFLYNLIGEIEYLSVVSKYIKWYNLPGYNLLLRAFLAEFKEKRLCDFTDRMKNLSLKLLSNERLINVLVVILLKKTNLNDPLAVETTLNMIDSYFISLAAHQSFVPSTFDYHFFLEGLKMVLQSDLQYCISQALLLIYNNLYHFSQQFGLQLSLYLLSGLFFRFFFHWSQNLRRIFHLLIIVRIARFSEERHAITPQKHNVLDVFTMGLKMKLKERLHNLLRMCQGLESKAKSIKIDAFCEKELYKRMRNRLNDKRIHSGKHKIATKDHSETTSKGNQSENKGEAPSKLIYFKDQQAKMPHPNQELQYVREALREYRLTMDEVDQCLQKDPQFIPEMKLKRMVDEHEIGPAKPDEW